MPIHGAFGSTIPFLRMNNTDLGEEDSSHQLSSDTLVPLCVLCQAKPIFSHEQIFMTKYRVIFHQCPVCGLLRSQSPTWLDAAYSNPIAKTDVGLVARNLEIARLLRVLFAFRLGADDRILDCAGGYGLLVRLLRDTGIPAYWHDKYCQNLLATGNEANPDRHFPVVTLFEALEHLHDPVTYLDALIAKCRPRMLVVSTTTYTGPPPAPGTWDYYSPETGQHITFYTERTLDLLAQRYGFVSQRLGMVRVFAAPGTVTRRMRFLALPRVNYWWRFFHVQRPSLLADDFAMARTKATDGKLPPTS